MFKTVIRLSALICLLLLTHCGPSEASIKKQVEEALFNEYHETFVVKSVHEQFLIHPHYTCIAYPVKHPKWEFRVTVSKESKNDLTSNYSYRKLIFQATEELENQIAGSPVKARVAVEPRFAISDSIEVNYDQLIRYQKNTDEINIYMAVFVPRSDTTDTSTYNFIRNVAYFYQKNGFNNYNIDAHYYLLENTKGTNIDSLDFCFPINLSYETHNCFDNNNTDNILYYLSLELGQHSSILTKEFIREKTYVNRKYYKSNH